VESQVPERCPPRGGVALVCRPGCSFNMISTNRLAIAARACATLSIVAAAGCGADPALDSVSGAATGSNPLVDVEYMTTIAPQGSPPAGVGYTDMALWAGNLYALRSDGTVEVRTRPLTAGSPSTFKSYMSGGPYAAIKSVPNGVGWNIIGAKDTTRKILRNVGGVPVVLGDYPTGINNIYGISGAPVSGGLKLYVLHTDGTPSGGRTLRTGTFKTVANSIVWDAATQPWGLYNNGICVVDGLAYTVVNYLQTFFAWYTPPSTIGYEVNLPPYTEHAYLNPGGFNDRFVPNPLEYDPIDGNFYGIDYSVLDASHTSWVIARMPKANLRP
jgi:hypothetical protein